MNDFSAKEIRTAVAQYNVLLEEGSDEAIENFLREYPAIDNYDSYGNYVGPIRNESGWTP